MALTATVLPLCARNVYHNYNEFSMLGIRFRTGASVSTPV